MKDNGKKDVKKGGFNACPLVFIGTVLMSLAHFWPSAEFAIKRKPHNRLRGLPFGGATGRNRTSDTRIFSPLLYQLSYRGRKSGGADESRTRDLLRDRQAC